MVAVRGKAFSLVGAFLISISKRRMNFVSNLHNSDSCPVCACYYLSVTRDLNLYSLEGMQDSCF